MITNVSPCCCIKLEKIIIEYFHRFSYWIASICAIFWICRAHFGFLNKLWGEFLCILVWSMKCSWMKLGFSKFYIVVWWSSFVHLKTCLYLLWYSECSTTFPDFVNMFEGLCVLTCMAHGFQLPMFLNFWNHYITRTYCYLLTI